MIDVVMPQMGESIVEGTLTRWLKKPGEHVERDEPLFEISTDKVDTEIPSPGAGVLADVLVEEGKTVAINTIVARINEGAGAISFCDRSRPSARNPQRRRRQRSRAPPRSRKKSGPRSGTCRCRRLSFRARASAGTCRGTPSAEEPTGPLSPVVRKMAREHNIDLRQVRGTGAGGRITKADVEAYMGQRGAAPEHAAPVAQSAGPYPCAAAQPAAPQQLRRSPPHLLRSSCPPQPPAAARAEAAGLVSSR